MSNPGEITRLLQQADSGDRDAANQLFSLVQDELRNIARKRRQGAGRFSPGDNMSLSALVDQAYCELVGQDVTDWQPGDRKKFYVYASTKIHDLLVETARARATQKRGGDRRQVDLQEDQMRGQEHKDWDDVTMLLDLKLTLEKFEQFAPEDGALFRLRYFLNCTFDEAGSILGISEATAIRRFERARMWLQKELKEYNA